MCVLCMFVVAKRVLRIYLPNLKWLLLNNKLPFIFIIIYVNIDWFIAILWIYFFCCCVCLNTMYLPHAVRNGWNRTYENYFKSEQLLLQTPVTTTKETLNMLDYYWNIHHLRMYAYNRNECAFFFSRNILHQLILEIVLCAYWISIKLISNIRRRRRSRR